jgi:TubC N-terminal docking domain
MTPVAALVHDLQARGVILESRGDRLAVRPVSRMTRDELETLRQNKREVLDLLAPLTLDPVTRYEVLGLQPDSTALDALHAEVRQAIATYPAARGPHDGAPVISFSIVSLPTRMPMVPMRSHSTQRVTVGLMTWRPRASPRRLRLAAAYPARIQRDGRTLR